MNTRVALVLASVVFFWMYFSLLAAFLMHPHQFPVLYAVLLISSLVSLTGACLLTMESRFARIERAAVLPLFLNLLFLLGTSALVLSGWSALPGDLGFAITGTGCLFLAPCALAFFYFSRLCRRTRTASVLLAFLFSCISLIGLIVVARDFFLSHGSIYASLSFFGIQWYMGMPVIGACLLACAMCEKDER